MINNLDRYKDDLEKLFEFGGTMESDLTMRQMLQQGTLPKEHEELAKKAHGVFEREYQNWYTVASAVVRQLIPDRFPEFELLYKGDPKRKEINSTNYNIQDWLNGVRAGKDPYKNKPLYNDFAITSMKFRTQIKIVTSVKARFESTLFDILQLAQADLFDSELDAAHGLIKYNFLRGAGAIAGVVLEKHLAQVAANHKITTRKKHPTISDFNDLLRKGSVLDMPVWRQIQRLADIRTLCDHNKDRSPTEDEVTELVNGVEKLTKTLF